jgi:hypothetical protein
MLKKAIVLLAAASAWGADSYLFTSFRGNGETGVFFALSDDGYKWTAVRGDQPVVPPGHAGMLMRDPFLVQGPDHVWQMVWTTGWTRDKQANRLTIGHASSRDLVNWSAQQMIDIPLEGARNAWAPEMAWDERQKQWIVFWASTIPGKFPDTEGTGDTGYNHRLYAMTTRDFKIFSKPALWFDPGFNAIDTTLAHVGSRWIMIFKDERKNPLQKRLRLAFADTPAGPWTGVTEPFTMDWIEGPSALQVGAEWLIYFDHYAKPHYYGAYRTSDWKTFEDVSKQVSLPEGHRHGTAVRIDAATAAKLRALK